MAKGFVGKGNGEGKLNDEDWARPVRNFRSLLQHHLQGRRPHPLWRDRRRLRRVARRALQSGAVRRLQHLASVHAGVRLHPDRQPELRLRDTDPTTVFAISEDDTWQCHASRRRRRRADRARPYADGGRSVSALRALPRHRRSRPALTAVARAGQRLRNAARGHAVLRGHRAAEHRRRRAILGDVDDRTARSNFGGTGTIVPMRYSVEQAALLVQGSYTFEDGRADGARGTPKNAPDSGRRPAHRHRFRSPAPKKTSDECGCDLARYIATSALRRIVSMVLPSPG